MQVDVFSFAIMAFEIFNGKLLAMKVLLPVTAVGVLREAPACTACTGA